MSSAAASPEREVLSGPVDVCVDRPLLSLDRPFTYDLAAEIGATVGSVVKVPFHGRATRGWILGPSSDRPARMLAVRALAAAVPAFDEEMLRLLRWTSERYVAPLAAVIDRAVPPRVAGEETRSLPASTARGTPAIDIQIAPRYRLGDDLVDAARAGTGTFLLRPAPEDEARLAVELVAVTLAGGRGAIVIVPDAEPVPATAAAIAAAFGDRVAWLVGGDRRARYRAWLDIRAGLVDVVVGTRPAVFAPLPRLGLVLVNREHHPQHREERAPHYHVRDVAVERARITSAACVLSSFAPTLEARALDHRTVEPTARAWPAVEVVRPGPEGRAPRLVRALREVRRAFLFEPMRGYGVARVCRSCARPAMCANCRGYLRAEEGAVRCAVCEAPGRCASCGGTSFGLARGGAERVAEWAADVATVPVRRPRDDETARPPGPEEVIVGGLANVKDFGVVDLELVAILGCDAALARPGIAARERALSAWCEVAAMARPHGRVIVQTDDAGDPAIQALVAGNPERFARSEAPRLAEAGFPAGTPVFRVVGTDALPDALTPFKPMTLLVSTADDATVCLAVVEAERVAAFGALLRSLAASGTVSRVEAEPHL